MWGASAVIPPPSVVSGIGLFFPFVLNPNRIGINLVVVVERMRMGHWRKLPAEGDGARAALIAPPFP